MAILAVGAIIQAMASLLLGCIVSIQAKSIRTLHDRVTKLTAQLDDKPDSPHRIDDYTRTIVLHREGNPRNNEPDNLKIVE